MTILNEDSAFLKESEKLMIPKLQTGLFAGMLHHYIMCCVPADWLTHTASCIGKQMLKAKKKIAQIGPNITTRPRPVFTNHQSLPDYFCVKQEPSLSLQMDYWDCLRTAKAIRHRQGGLDNLLRLRSCDTQTQTDWNPAKLSKKRNLRTLELSWPVA